jgi:hypothetical protein
MASRIGRRKFVATLGGGAIAWPFAASAQQPTMPVIGFLSSSALADRARYIARIPARRSRNRLRRGEEPHHRTAVRRLPIRPDAGVSC